MTTDGVHDPALALAIPSPQAYWRRHLSVLVPLVGWLVLALPTIVVVGETPSWGWVGLLIALVVAGVALVIWAVPRTWRQARALASALRARKQQQLALAALHDEPGRAETIWRACLEDPRLPPYVAAPVVHNVGVALLVQGRLPRARALMLHARATGWIDSWLLRRHRAAYLQGVALTSALAGDTATAREVLAVLASSKVSPQLAPYVGQTRLMLLLRQGDVASAAALARTLDPSPLPGPSAQLGHLVAAFAYQQAGDTAARDAALARVGRLEGGNPAWGPEHWPELVAFAAQHGLYDG